MRYRDRCEAGKQLAEVLKTYAGDDCLVLGIPRGGVVVAAQVAKILGAPLDIIIPRKVGAPYNPEVAIGAMTQDGTMICDQKVISLLGVSEVELQEEVDLVKEEIRRRSQQYRGNKPFPDLTGKNVILVDDGIATGYTVRAALKSIKAREPKELVLAVPVGPKETLDVLAAEVDKIVCPYIPDEFYAVGQFYVEFDQVTDQEVIHELREELRNPI